MTSVILNLKYLLINPINWVYLSVQGELQINIKALYVAADRALYIPVHVRTCKIRVISS